MEDHATSSVVGKVVESLLDGAKTHIGYIWNSTENGEKLKNEAEKLKLMRANVQKHITSAKRKGDDLLDGVQHWVDKAGVEVSDAEEILKQEAKAKKAKFGNNWGTRYQYGKQATNMTSSLLQHQKTGKNFEICVSVETRAPGPLDVYQNKNLEDLVTHNSALNAVIAALEDESIQIIGIYGLGGVGKTTLAKEVVTRVKNNLFDDVAFTTVSQSVKVEEIRKDIEQATKRIMKGDKILIILDDVWEKLNLEELCIPYGSNHMNCKILLTSRNQDVCEKMNAQSKICVNSLPTKEAWTLFKRVVGEQVETEADLKPVAMKVVEECGGLPLLIQVVGNALKSKSIRSWNFALSRLKKHAPSEIDVDIRKAFTHLKLSYDYLESAEAKSCFLICSMFPEDGYIYLEDLVHYMVGMRKFDDLDSIEDARDKVWTAVNILISSCLLLNVGDGKHSTKMHDVVRDVALLIASKGENNFLVEAGKGLKEWLPNHNSLERYTGISLMNNRISKLPDFEVHLPCLDIFIINQNPTLQMISNELIQGMKEVKVLNMSNIGSPSLPQSLKLLTKLRMLNLAKNKSFHEISILGEMKDLEILNLNETGITEIPKEIGQLVKLRLLEVNNCKNQSRMAPGVISKLQWLEELSIGLFRVLEGVYDCIVEVMNLSKLTYLNLAVRDIDDIPDQGFNFPKLKGFFIEIGEYDRQQMMFSTPWRLDRDLVLSTKHLRIPLLNRIKKFIEASRPVTVLKGMENLSNIMPTLYDEGFNKLEQIELKNCSNVSCLVDESTSSDWDEGKTSEKYFMVLKILQLMELSSLEVLWKCPDEYISLTNLVSLSIHRCNKLERVFTVSVAQGLVSLEYLSIWHCDGLEEVIWGGGGADSANTIIVFPSLTIISILVSSLKSFYSGNCTIKYPSLEKVEIARCGGMKIWGSGIHETPNLKVFNDSPLLDGPSALNDAVAKSCDKWKRRS